MKTDRKQLNNYFAGVAHRAAYKNSCNGEIKLLFFV